MKSVLLSAVALAAVMAGAPALATTVSDPAGDFLGTYTGPLNSDLDIRSVTVFIDKTNDFVISATLAGPLGQTANADYVFGVNTGSGLPLFGASENKVLFDSAVVLNTGHGSNPSLVASNLLNPGGPTITVIGSGAGTGSVTVSGDTISAVIPEALLPGSFAADQYGFNVWSRIGISDSFPTNFADFAPDNGTFAAIPEPASWGLMILGFAGLGAAARARRQSIRAAMI